MCGPRNVAQRISVASAAQSQGRYALRQGSELSAPAGVADHLRRAKIPELKSC
jgi:hypothetical protein